ncbi:acetyltransferase [Psychroflexus salis]|uniref:Acetyltransferase n=1 Tax=Psychroflexus salis TaxID=1526574 RepID=A0A917E5J8_9FLAO|nr:acetyltransferase [Psychroflexus salis]GGE05157.1 acetyltransferase [Psychroflexus salis]
MKKINLFGASGHAKVIIDIIESNGFEVGYIFDDNPDIKLFLGREVISNYNDVQLNSNPLIISIGDNAVRKKIVKKLNAVQLSPGIAHPSAIISPYSKIGKGTVIMPNAVINSDAYIGENCIINTSAVIEHDCIIEDFAHISPNVSLAGGVKIGESSHVGIGTSIIQCIKIGKNTIVGAGAVVSKSLPPNCTAVGIPAKPIKFHK